MNSNESNNTRDANRSNFWPNFILTLLVFGVPLGAKLALSTTVSAQASGQTQLDCTQAITENNARIITDKDDYAPGETVYITGAGFCPGETVSLQVLHVGDTTDDDLTSPAHQPWTVEVDDQGRLLGRDAAGVPLLDANGQPYTTWQIPAAEDEAGAVLELTATGQASGLVAKTQFTDANSSTTLASSKNPSCSGDAVTFTATVSKQGSSGSGDPTGTVTFKDGSTTLGPAASLSGAGGNSSTATFTTSALSAGSHSITAVYSGDGTYTTSTSAVFTQ